MKLKKKIQYGLLFGLYLTKAGRASTQVASENLGISAHFLEQVARSLRIAGIVSSHRGPGGGYELIGNPRVGEFFTALAPVKLLTSAESMKYSRGESEHRAFAAFVGGMSRAFYQAVEAKTIRDMYFDTVNREVAHLNADGAAQAG